MRAFPKRTAVICCMAFLLGGLSAAAAEQAEPDFATFYERLSEGNYAEAVEAGKVVLEAIGSQKGKAEAAEEVAAGLQAVEDARAATVGKLDRIAESAKAERPDPLLYILPQPGELFRDVYGERRRRTVTGRGLTEKEQDFVRSYVKSALALADASVVEAYSRVLASGVDDFARRKARAYLSAYTVGAHDSETYPAVLRMISEATGGACPFFLAYDALEEMGSSWAVKEVLTALDALGSSGFPAEDRSKILNTVAKAAEETEQDYATAVWAYRKLAAQSDQDEAEKAQLSIINVYADRLKDYANGAAECSTYLERFPSGKDTARVRCVRALCLYRLGDLDRALSETRQIADDYQGTGTEAYALLLEGVVQAKKGDLDAAVAAYNTVVEKHPTSDFAARALLFAGVAYLQRQRYSEARECFQRIVDFHPDSSQAAQAKDYIERLAAVVGQGGDEKE